MIAIIDVTGHNLRSLTNAILHLGFDCVLTHDAQTIHQASHVILPGVGSASVAMKALRDHRLVEVLRQLNKPLLGICLGMQLLCEYSEEGDVDCLGLLAGRVEHLPVMANHPIPHMGWNNLLWTKASPLAEGLAALDYVYFVHSYALLNSVDTVATCQYSQLFSAIVQRGTIYGMQFHPEKSAQVGLTLLRNFLELEV